MGGQLRLAAGASIANGLCALATRHAQRIAESPRQRQRAQCRTVYAESARQIRCNSQFRLISLTCCPGHSPALMAQPCGRSLPVRNIARFMELQLHEAEDPLSGKRNLIRRQEFELARTADKSGLHQFFEQKYVVLKSLLGQNSARLLYDYVVELANQGNCKRDRNVANALALYAGPCMENLLLQLLPIRGSKRSETVSDIFVFPRVQARRCTREALRSPGLRDQCLANPRL
jgi:hypothetical protein